MRDQLVFRKSSYSGQGVNCIEIAPIPTRFRKSTHSGGSNDCVEVAPTSRSTALRDSQHPHHGHLTFPAAEWDAFLAAARNGAL
ncbi:DUF397 domain-containing protein [Streptomonospora litoralis]|uniref:DUF397 domain-containing protein n=1 Tax=Streptomonospora litoralis TaxID=2498135 RepID=A0A4P6Q5F0_9ACTN|nr:DUF397 domain-containing protein [Streptomonospora litoralis]QBI53987.1 hypothetical protein EKD16_11010 [Streptomonospora litoralis]